MTKNLSPAESNKPQGKIPKHQVGIYGWRKRCLYAFILFIFAILIINVALTVWIIRVMDFSIRGMGKLQIIEKGVRMNGEAEFLQSLYTSSVKTRDREDLFVESSGKVIIHARDYLDRITNEVKIGGGKVESVCENFIVRHRNGTVNFGVSEEGLTLASDRLSIPGMSIDDMVQTPLVRGPDRDSLRVQSLTRDVKVTGPESVEVRAPAGKIYITSLDDITLTSSHDGIRFDANNLFIKNLPVSSPHSPGDQPTDIYQLCMCKGSGRLFMDKPDGQCTYNPNICS